MTLPWSRYSDEEWENGYTRETSSWMDHHMGALNGDGDQEMTAVTLGEDVTRCHLNRSKRQRSHPTASQALQQNPKFKSLFDQLEYGPQARQAAAEALMGCLG
ncbi:hypothetical protein M0R45_009293 [Rubus argutus]|uniref:Uncharacterized protein n=1 Tax=Rubus argutus TaxID=59490 RepID=A0AAW1Y4F0_RUBAR